MDEEMVKRAYSRCARYYDLLFGRIFKEGRQKAIELLEIKEGERILEVGIGTGLSLRYYPPYCEVVGIDISYPMLQIAEERVRNLRISNVTLRLMDAVRMGFDGRKFDGVIAAYVMSATPDPVGVLRAMKEVCKPGGRIIILNHFCSDNRFLAPLERLLSPLCQRLGFRTGLTLEELLEGVELEVKGLHRVNLFKGWKVIQCLNNTAPETIHSKR